MASAVCGTCQHVHLRLQGTKKGETWSVDGAGHRYQRWWGEEHFGNGWVRRFGNSTTGEHAACGWFHTLYVLLPWWCISEACTKEDAELWEHHSCCRGAACHSTSCCQCVVSGNQIRQTTAR